MDFSTIMDSTIMEFDCTFSKAVAPSTHPGFPIPIKGRSIQNAYSEVGGGVSKDLILHERGEGVVVAKNAFPSTQTAPNSETIPYRDTILMISAGYIRLLLCLASGHC